ncbi:insulin-like growth factor 1 receptor isoform X2 [Ptychodera flava]|uniref:insulin-like growth factor 1 receptor isoform X2 n=1 Tax=Ptychodera flava TaxID=63121 RepID=UPI003969D242
MEPYAILSVVTDDVRFYSSLRLQCLYYNVDRNPLLFELNGESLSEDDAVIWMSDPSMSALLIINNMTEAFEGTYRCKVYSTDDNIFAVSNAVNVSIQGCQSGVWGQQCDYRCNCVNHINCDRYNGCVCESGWEGRTCEQDVQPPSVECPPNITLEASDTSAAVNVNWPVIKSSDNDGLPKVLSNFQSGDTFYSGTTIVTYQAVDRSNNSVFCSFAVHIKDLGNKKVYEIKSWETIIALIAFLVLFIIVTVSLLVLKMRKTKRKYTPLLPERIHIPDGVTVFKKSQITKGNLIGEGEFSSVYSGCLRRKGLVTRVALKILKDNTVHNPAYQHEISTLNLLQGCPRLVKLIGVSMEEGEKSIITELMSTDMHTLLRTDNVENISVAFGSRLQKFCLHVAEALQYMEKIKVVHRDIAARNVLISHDDMAKIGDFGLARDVYETLVYQRHPSQHHFKVPIRWMSPESLRESIYTHSSDMWSFGVFMWETAALGDMPYHNIDTTQLVERLKDGYRLPQPQHCSDNFYNLMRRCWRWDSTERATATMAVDVLNAYTKENTGVFA